MRIAALAPLWALVLVFGLCAPALAGDNAAPEFTLKDLENKDVKLSEVCKNGPVVIAFWSTWCKNCPDEMKQFQRMYDQYKDQGLTVLGVSIDCSKTVSKVRPWIQGRRFTFPILLDTANNVKRLYNVNPVPHSFIIDKAGQIVYSHIGYRPGDEKAYEAEIVKLLKPSQS